MKISRRPFRLPRSVQRGLIALAAIGLIRILLPREQHPKGGPEHRVEQVRVVDWSAVDQAVRQVFQDAGEKAEAFAVQAVHEWAGELRRRAEEDFIPWYFSYWNQQAMALNRIGFTLMDTPIAEGLFGKQPGAEERMQAMIGKAFVSRVLQPATARLKIEAITRETVTVYLDTLNQELKVIQADYAVSGQDWDRYLGGLAGSVAAVEGSRQVPLILKGATIGSGGAAVKIGQAVTGQIRRLLLRRGSREMLEEGMLYAGRGAARGFGGIAFAVMTGWDLYDHQRTVAQNLPVMRGLLNDCIDQLENLVLRDPQGGILQTLERVRRTVSEDCSKNRP